MTFGIVSIKIWKQRVKMTVAGLWGCVTAAAVLNKDKPLPSQIASRAGSAADSLSNCVTAHALVTLGLLSACVPGQREWPTGLQHVFCQPSPLPYTQHPHTKRGAMPQAHPQLARADRARAIPSNLEHIAYKSDLKNGLHRHSFGYLGLVSLLWVFAIQAYKVYSKSLAARAMLSTCSVSCWNFPSAGVVHAAEGIWYKL